MSAYYNLGALVARYRQKPLVGGKLRPAGCAMKISEPLPPLAEVKKDSPLPAPARRLGSAPPRHQDGQMRDVLAAWATRPVQAKTAAYTGYSDLVAAAQTPRGPALTGIPAPVQAKMERAFGADFSDVRVHAASARAGDLG